MRRMVNGKEVDIRGQKEGLATFINDGERYFCLAEKIRPRMEDFNPTEVEMAIAEVAYLSNHFRKTKERKKNGH